jgi:hypothetical protein
MMNQENFSMLSSRHGLLTLYVPDAQTEQQFVMLAVQVAVKTYRQEHPPASPLPAASGQEESSLPAE